MADTKDDGPTGAVDEYGSTGATGATGGVSANNAAFRHWEERLTAVETGLADLERRIEDAFEHKV